MRAEYNRNHRVLVADRVAGGGVWNDDLRAGVTAGGSNPAGSIAAGRV